MTEETIATTNKPEPKKKTALTVLKNIIVKPYLVFEFIVRAIIIIALLIWGAKELFFWIAQNADKLKTP